MTPCATCNGRGEIGGWTGPLHGDGDYDSEPCPDCTPLAVAERVRKIAYATTFVDVRADLLALIDENEKLRGMPDDDRKSAIALMELLAVERQRTAGLRAALVAINRAVDDFWNANPKNREPEIKALCLAQQQLSAAISKALPEFAEGGK